jgi:hypothetical protein
MRERAVPMGAEPVAGAAEQPDPPQAERLSLEELVAGIGTETAAMPLPATGPAAPALRSARLVALDGAHATIAWRGHVDSLEAEIAPEVEKALLDLALRSGDGVLVEMGEKDKPVIVGVLQTRLPRELHVAADKIHLDAAREIVLRAGRAALRLREDGDVELVGSRISAASRGLFRLVGRVLRLN